MGLNQIRSTGGKLVNSGRTSNVNTTDATPTIIDTLTLGANSGGVVQYTAKGVAANGDTITISQIVRFKKAAGTLTLGTPADILASVVDAGLSGGSIAISAASNNINVTVTGKAAVNVSWKCNIIVL
ncbi:MAG: hypothetical protein ABI237_05940 [Ginsengibacter sp.]